MVISYPPKTSEKLNARSVIFGVRTPETGIEILSRVAVGSDNHHGTTLRTPVDIRRHVRHEGFNLRRKVGDPIRHPLRVRLFGEWFDTRILARLVV